MSLDFYMQKYMNLDKIRYADLVSMFSFKISPKAAGEIIRNAVNSKYIAYSQHYVPNDLYYKGSNFRPTILCHFFKIIDVIEWAQKERALNPDFPIVFNDEFVEHHKNRVRVFSETAQKQKISENMDIKSFFRFAAVKIAKRAEKKCIDVDDPLLIYAISCCFDIEIYKDVSKPKSTYNEGGKNGRYHYGTIKGYVANIVKGGTKGGGDRSIAVKSKSLLKALVTNNDYDELRKEFMAAQKLWHD
ncbi:MAG: hypothetical protein LBB25_02910 [Holosporaceae bacterium]|nr:hypothetical protein [Holosporaceae bacterium]